MGLRVSILLLVVSSAVLADPTEDFENRVRPLLAKNCYACHRQTAMGGLRLDSREAILKGGASGPAAVAGQPAESLLVKAVEHTHEHLKMPPTGKLKPEEAAILRQWVSDGLFWPAEAPTQTSSANSGEYVITPEHRSFWSFQPVETACDPGRKGQGDHRYRRIRTRTHREGRFDRRAPRRQAQPHSTRNYRPDGPSDPLLKK
jgi:hypothetical protein